MTVSYYLRKFDFGLLLIILLLLSFGLALQYSLGLENIFFFKRQLFFVLIGLVLFFLFSFIDYRNLSTFAYLLYFLTLILLITALFWGESFRGIKGWISFFGFHFQLVELAKLILVILLAKFWSLKQNVVLPRHILLSAFFVLIPTFLVALQPDLGSALIFFIVWFLFLLAIDHKIKHYLFIFLISFLVFILSWSFFLKPYQKERILSFLNPERDPFHHGYQITQSKIAIGSGQLFGRGLGLGPQSQLHFLPATKTDFVFSTLSEELGFFGASLILLFFFLLFRKFSRIAQLAHDNFTLLLVLGMTILFFSQVFINIGMNLGLIPVVGIPLPLISYGGSSLVMNLILLGILENIIIQQKGRLY